MPSIHFVERKNNVRKIPDAPGEWESGCWLVSHPTADVLVGGELYLHEKQNAASHFGGVILSWRPVDDLSKPDLKGRVIFRFRATPEHRGIRVGPDGWGNEKNIRV